MAHKRADSSIDSIIYGVYSAYESDYMGAFHVMAGVTSTDTSESTAAPTSKAGYTQLALQAGTYLVFSGTGSMH